MEFGESTKFVLFGIALIASGFFSASEAAFLSMQRGKLAVLKKTDPEKVSRMLRFTERPEKLLATVLSGNNLTNTAAAALGTGIALTHFSEGTAVLVSTIGVTIVLLIFAEAIPKTVATRYSIGFASLVATPLRIVEIVLLPPVWLLERLVRTITTLLGLPESHIVSQDEIQALIELGKETGSVQASQADLLGQVFRLEDRRVSEAMTHRTRIAGVPEGATLSEFLQISKAHGHTRYPVFRKNLDDLIGILSIQDVLGGMAENQIDPDSDVTIYMREPVQIPESKKIGELFSELSHIGSEMYVLIDEHGGVSGIVTLRQLVSEVIESYDLEDPGQIDEFVKVSDTISRVLGELPIDELEHELDVLFPHGPYETVGGMVMDRIGHIPIAEEFVDIEGFRFTILEMDGFKISELEITRIEPIRVEATT